MIVDYSGAGVLSKLFYMRGSGGYAPHMRVNGSPQQWEWVNNANNAINMSLSDGGVLNLPRARPTWAGVTPWDTGNLPSPAQTNGSIYTALHLRLASGTDSTWNFSGQAGQPSWMWGSNDGANMLVWNPANFSVNYANSAGVAASANSVGGVTDPASRSAGAQFGGGVSVAANFGLNYSSQGGKFVWNDVGTGETCLVNNQGLGSGGFVFRTVNNANTAELGRFTITAAGAGSQGSDRNLKEDIQDLSDSLDKIRSIRGVSYAYKANGEKHYGVIAQEVREVFPYCVNENHGAGTKEKYLGVSYSDLVAPLIEAVKELADKLDNANARIAALEMRNAA
jgi:hypothetical protein